MNSLVGLALVVCDEVYREVGGKFALIGLFNEIRCASFPARHPRLCVFVSLTDMHPGTTLRLDIVDGETDERILRLEGPPPLNTNPTAICDLQFTLDSLTLPREGTYYIQFWGNDKLLLQRPFHVRRVES